MQEETLWWTNTQLLESLFMSHWKDNGLNKFLNLLVQTSDIRVFFRWPLIDLHSLNSRVIVGRQLLIDDKTLLVHRDEIAWFDVFWLNHAEDGQIDSMPGCSLNDDRFLRLSLRFSLLDREARALLPLLWLLFNIKQLTDVCNHVGQLGRHLKLLLIFSQPGLI